MRFRVWCPERGQGEADGVDVDAPGSNTAASDAARQWWDAGDRFKSVQLYVKGEITLYVVDVIPEPPREVRFHTTTVGRIVVEKPSAATKQ